jgi:hypothetical protein
MPILRTVETREPPEQRRRMPRAPGRDDALPQPSESLWALGQRLTWVAALVLTVSAFTGWYSGSGEGIPLSVTGWDTGTLGKLVFAIGVAVLALVVMREAGIDLPATFPESLVVIFLGSLATVFVLIRLVSIPDRFLPADGRSIGIWISLTAALALIVAGLLQASEEL